jgi:hypothetical protein
MSKLNVSNGAKRNLAASENSRSLLMLVGKILITKPAMG